MKKFIAVVLIFILVLTNCIVFANNISSKVYVNNLEIESEDRILKVDNYFMLPLRSLCENFGIEIVWFNKYEVAVINDSDRSLLVIPNSTEVVLNDEIVLLSNETKLIDEKLYVPHEFVEKCFSRKVEIKDESVYIGEKTEEFSLENETNGKKIYALYHGFRRTRDHDGDLGSWKIYYDTTNSATGVKYINYNPDLVDYEGYHQVASANGGPIVGMFSERDEDYIEYKILLAKIAGLDGFMMDYIFPEHSNTVMIEDFIKVAEKYDFEIGVDWLDSSIRWVQNYEGHDDIKTQEDLVDYSKVIFQYAWDKFYSGPTAAQFDGRPLFFFFGGGVSNEEFVEIKTADYDYPETLGEPIYVRRGQSAGRFTNGEVVWDDLSIILTRWKPVGVDVFSWIAPKYRTDRKAYLQWDKYGTLQDNIDFLDKYQEMWKTEEKNNVNVATIWPGFDNRGCADWGGGTFAVNDRMDGDLYRILWNYYVDNEELMDLIDIMFIASWSDFTEGHEIEPTVANGYREIITTQKYAAEFKGIDSEVNPDNLYLPQQLFELRKDISKLRKIGFYVDDLDVVLDLAAKSISEEKFRFAEELLNLTEKIVAEHYENVVVETVNVKTIAVKHNPAPIETVEEYKEIIEKNEISRGKPVRTNSEQVVHLASNVVDGDTSANSYWITADTQQTFWLEINLGKEYDVSAIDLFAGQAAKSTSLLNFKFQYLDGFVWRDIPGAGMESNTSSNTDIKFELEQPVRTSKVRLVCYDGARAARVREIKIYENVKKTVLNKPVVIPDATGSYDVENGLYLTIPDDILDKLDNYYEGELSFEYWGGSAEKLLISSDTNRVATQKIGTSYGDYSVIADITQNPSNIWEKCTVRLYQENITFNKGKEASNGHIRFVGKSLVKNPNISFKIYKIKK